MFPHLVGKWGQHEAASRRIKWNHRPGSQRKYGIRPRMVCHYVSSGRYPRAEFFIIGKGPIAEMDRHSKDAQVKSRQEKPTMMPFDHTGATFRKRRDKPNMRSKRHHSLRPQA